MQLKDYVNLIKGQKNYIKIKVTPRQSKTEFYGVLDDGTLKIRLKAIPEKGKANEELIRFISDSLDIKKNIIEIIAGAGDSIKLVRISY